MEDRKNRKLTPEGIAKRAMQAGRLQSLTDMTREEIRDAIANEIREWAEKKLEGSVFSNELNQRLTSAIKDEDFPNEGSVIAGLAQEEVYIQLKKDELVSKPLVEINSK